MRLMPLLLIVSAFASAEDFERFKLKDGRTLEGEYRNGAVVMLDGQVSIPVAEADIVARAVVDRPKKEERPEKAKPKPEKPEKEKPKGQEAAPDYMADLIAIHDRIHGELTNKADALALYAAKTKAYAGFYEHANLDPVDSQEREARNLNLELERSKKAREAGDKTGFSVTMSLYAKYKAPWASYFLKTTVVSGDW
jgi:hypothetical protein